MDKAPVYPGRSFKAVVGGGAGRALMQRSVFDRRYSGKCDGQNPGDLSTLEE